jgi:hypothetical protein
MTGFRRTSLALGLAAGLGLAGCGEAEDPAALSPESTPQARSAVANAASGQFHTHLTGAEEVPAVETLAQGQATFKLSKDGTELSYRLIVANIVDVLMAHIHLGPPGCNCPVVVWLYPDGPPPQLIEGTFQGVLATGVITAADLVGPLAGGSLEDLVEEIESGNTYVNVHTSANPGGEVRGQIEP